MEQLVLIEAPGKLGCQLGDRKIRSTGIDTDGERTCGLVEGPPGARVLDEVAAGAILLPIIGEGTGKLASQGVALG